MRLFSACIFGTKILILTLLKYIFKNTPYFINADKSDGNSNFPKSTVLNISLSKI